MSTAISDRKPTAGSGPEAAPGSSVFAAALHGSGCVYIPIDPLAPPPVIAHTLDSLRALADAEEDVNSSSSTSSAELLNASLGGLTGSLNSRPRSESSASVTPRLLSDLQQVSASPLWGPQHFLSAGPPPHTNAPPTPPAQLSKPKATDLFLGQICRHYTIKFVKLLLNTLVGHTTVRRVKAGPHNVCAFVSVNGADADALCGFHKRVLCDVNGIWVARSAQQSEALGAAAEWFQQQQHDNMRRFPCDDGTSQSPAMPRSAMVIERPHSRAQKELEADSIVLHVPAAAPTSPPPPAYSFVQWGKVSPSPVESPPPPIAHQDDVVYQPQWTRSNNSNAAVPFPSMAHRHAPHHYGGSPTYAAAVPVPPSPSYNPTPQSQLSMPQFLVHTGADGDRMVLIPCFLVA